MAGRFGWGLGDQLLSSITNFLLVILVARVVTPRELGAFSIAFAVFILSLGGARALSGEPLVVRYSSVPTDRWREGVRLCAGTAMTAGIVVGVGCIVAAAVTGGPVRPVLFVVGVSLPFLLLQDSWRFAFFAAGRGGGAFLNDLVWATSMFATIGFLMSTGRSSIASVTGAWAAAGCLATGVGIWQLRVVPSSPADAWRWLKRQRDLAPRFFTEFAVSIGAANLTFFAIGALAGLAALGQVRAGQIALGPLNVLFAGVGLVTVPESVRLLHESPRRMLIGSRVISSILTLAVLAWLVIVLLLPAGLGETVLGANWQNARSIVVPLSILSVGYAFAFGAMAGLRALAAAKRSLRVRFVDATSILVFPLGGAVLGGASGAAWGLAVAGLVKIPNAWWQFSRARHEHERGRAADEVGVLEPVSDVPS
jgi:O-antigen/teichoic acid export membrane protein